VGEDRRGVGEENVTEQLFGDLHHVRLAFERRQVTDEPDQGGEVVPGRRADDHGTRRTRPNACRLSM